MICTVLTHHGCEGGYNVLCFRQKICANRKCYKMTACSVTTCSTPPCHLFGNSSEMCHTAIKSTPLMPVTDSRGYLVENSKCQLCSLYLLSIFVTQPALWHADSVAPRHQAIFLTTAHSSQKVNTDKREAQIHLVLQIHLVEFLRLWSRFKFTLSTARRNRNKLKLYCIWTYIRVKRDYFLMG